MLNSLQCADKLDRLDAFALNIGDATQPFVMNSVTYLYEAANSIGDFSLFISMDVYASGAACYASGTSCKGPEDYATVLNYALAQPSYLMGPTGNPFISSREPPKSQCLK